MKKNGRKKFTKTSAKAKHDKILKIPAERDQVIEAPFWIMNQPVGTPTKTVRL